VGGSRALAPVALAATVVGGCWNLDNPCDPVCPQGTQCREGQCLPLDAGVPDAGPPVTVDGGQTIWAEQYGGDKAEGVSALTTSPKTGDVIIGGNYQSGSNGSSDGFVQCVSETSGKPRWYGGYGGVHSDTVSSVVVTADGTVWAAGGFYLDVDFDGVTLSSNGMSDIFLIALSGDKGTRLHLQRFGMSSYDIGKALVPTTTGNGVRLTGRHRGTIDVGGDPLYSKGGDDTFLAEYRSDASHVWSRSWGGKDAEDVADMALAPDGSLYLAGHFRETVDFGDRKPRVSNGKTDVYLLRTDAKGAPRWVRTFGSDEDDVALGVAVDGKGNVYLGGYINGSAWLGGKALPHVHQGDGFVASFDDQGHHRWSFAFGAQYGQVVNAVRVNGQGRPVIGGHFSGEIRLGGYKLTSKGNADGFVALLEQDGRLRWVRQLGGPGDVAVRALAVAPNDEIFAAGTFKQSLPTGKGKETLKSAGDTDIFLLRLSR
jgi:hypothetical protein